MKKIWNKKVTLIYDGIGIKYPNNIKNKNIILDYLSQRYSCEDYKLDKFNNQVILNTRLRNLFISEEESDISYKKFRKQILG